MCIMTFQPRESQQDRTLTSTTTTIRVQPAIFSSGDSRCLQRQPSAGKYEHISLRHRAHGSRDFTNAQVVKSSHPEGGGYSG